MSISLIPLAIFEAKAAEINRLIGEDDPRRNGLACPVCESELFDTKEQWVDMMYPLKKKIHCEECDFRGSREYVSVGVVRRILQEEELVQQGMLVRALRLLERAAPYLKTKYTSDETRLEEDIDGFLEEVPKDLS